MGLVYLAIAIVAEVIGTTALQASDQFSKPLPSIIVVVGYCLAFYLLSFALKTIPVGVAYAIWSGLGIALIAIAGYFFFGQKLDLAAIIGMCFIVAGVLIMNVFSSTSTH